MEFWSNLGSIMATMIFLRAIVNDYLAPEFYDLLKHSLRKLLSMVSSYISVVIEENDGMKVSEVYEAVQTYLSARSYTAAKRLKLNKNKNSKEFTFSMASNEEIADEFEGIKVWWVFHSKKVKRLVMFSSNSAPDEKRYYELTFHKKHRHKIFEAYLPHVMSEAKTLELRNRHLKIYTNKSGDPGGSNDYRAWTPVVFDHPATFQTLALEPQLKREIMDDLLRFSRGETYYRKVGRAWKRGYLLYGPPGTGKSSLIAAMANFLEYDIYDLELTQVKNNAQLRKLLITTTNRSIIVIEDIDCSLDLSDRRNRSMKHHPAPPPPPNVTDRKKNKKPPPLPLPPPEEQQPPAQNDEIEWNQDSRVTLSGVLNFTDGLWSCCGSERLFVFTTNHIDRLDPALLRRGRMDKHILLSFCTFRAFKTLARNYLDVESHELFPEIKCLMETAQMTPADVTEYLLQMRDHPTCALQNLIEALSEAKDERPAHPLNGLSFRLSSFGSFRSRVFSA